MLARESPGDVDQSLAMVLELLACADSQPKACIASCLKITWHEHIPKRTLGAEKVPAWDML
jgi:hypothetical protein